MDHDALGLHPTTSLRRVIHDFHLFEGNRARALLRESSHKYSRASHISSRDLREQDLEHA